MKKIYYGFTSIVDSYNVRIHAFPFWICLMLEFVSGITWLNYVENFKMIMR